MDAAHGRPVTVRQGSGHMCVCRRVRAEPEPQPARERTGSSEMPDGVGARGERQKLQRACNWKHTFHDKNLSEKKGAVLRATRWKHRARLLLPAAQRSAGPPCSAPPDRSMGD